MVFRVGIFLSLLAFLSILFWYMAQEEKTNWPKLTVFAASSFAYVLNEEEDRIENRLSIDLVVVEAASSTLARQIENGAPADIFISADQTWLQTLENDNLLAARPIVLGENTLVLVIAQDRVGEFCKIQFFSPPTAPDFLAACPFDGKVVTGDPQYVPLGRYARQALDRYSLSLNLVPVASAREAFAYLNTGSVKAAILFGSDTKNLRGGFSSFLFPHFSHDRILYLAAPLKESTNPAKENFLDFLKSEEFKTILKTKGFETG